MSCDMKGGPNVYLDVHEYERIRSTGEHPVTWCTEVEGYWVQIVPLFVYEHEYRGLLDADEQLSIYIKWDLTRDSLSGKL